MYMVSVFNGVTNELVATKKFKHRSGADQFKRRWEAMSSGMRIEIVRE